MQSEISLSEAIASLRTELENALSEGADKPLGFEIGDVKLTVTTSASRSREAGGKVRWWLVEGGADVGRESADVQTLELSLRPVLRGDADEVSGPLVINDPNQSEPGR